jgi:hypothetical protein
MTELVDLIEDPKEKLSTLYQKHVKNLEEDFQREEEQLDRTFISYRTKIASYHKAILNKYKGLYDEMLCILDRQEDPMVVRFFEEYLRANDYGKRDIQHIFKKLHPALVNSRKNGGQVHVEVKELGAENASVHRSGGIVGWAEEEDGGYFFIDSYRDNDFERQWKFTVEKKEKTWEERNKEEKKQTVWQVMQSSDASKDLLETTVEEMIK